MSSNLQLDSAKLLKLLDDGGPLSRALPNFEMRKEQQAMMRDVINAFNERQIALVEAGTGTGKSMAYLIPSMIAAILFKEKVVISTNTISLQEQLLYKDIPLIENALGISLKASLVKGMNNYICIRKQEEVQSEMLLLAPKEREELDRVFLCTSQHSFEGSKSKLPFIPSAQTWDLIGAEHDTCTNVECPNYQSCYYFQARKGANDAALLIVNHHLLFADLAMRAETQNYTAQAVLPPFDRLILDEAHNIEEIATDYFASRLSKLELLRIVGRLNSEKTAGKSFGKLSLLKEKIYPFLVKEASKEAISLLNRLTIELPALRKDLLKAIAEAFQLFHQYMIGQAHEEQAVDEGKLRLQEQHLKDPAWSKGVSSKSLELLNMLRSYVQALSGLDGAVKCFGSEKMIDQTKQLRFEIKALSKRLEDAAKMLDEFSAVPFPPNNVKWIESEVFRGSINTSLINANLDVSRLLATHLFEKFSTIILCSATMTSNRKFDFFRGRLGLSETFSKRKVTESIYDSPFDFTRQSLLLVPQDLPLPSHHHFIEQASSLILKLLHASQGNAFVLFTSYSMLQKCAGMLCEKLKKGRFYLLKQGDENRIALLEKFKKTERSVLFGTDSFWEGVDVVGDALRCVIIVKLPFKVPSDPLLQARAEAIAARGQDPFFTFFMPHAIIKFKQGFGRLIRNKKDRGCIVCLDNRLVTKQYGKFFLNSLPPCRQVIASENLLQQYMIDFYKKTDGHGTLSL